MEEYQVRTLFLLPFPSSLSDSHPLLLQLAIGVDLGTTFSVVGVRVGGKVTIIEDDQHHTIFPSVVSYLENEG